MIERRFARLGVVTTAFTATCVITATTAVGEVITFDDLGALSGTIVTDQYAGLGVVFSTLSGPGPTLVTASGPIFPGDPQGLFDGEGFTNPLIVDFIGTATTAGAFIDFGNIGSGIMIEAFDGAGGTGSSLGSASTVTESFISVDAAGIKSVMFSQFGAGGATYLIDHFTFEVVPAPGTLALLGVAGLVSRRRRR